MLPIFLSLISRNQTLAKTSVRLSGLCNVFATLMLIVFISQASGAGPEDAFTLYPGFRADQKVLAKTVTLKVTSATQKTVDASSAEACAASRRVFERISFLFKQRQDVLALLGEPSTISDYNRKAVDKPDAPLVYVFDSGFGGWQYTLTFVRGTCVGIVAEVLE